MYRTTVLMQTAIIEIRFNLVANTTVTIKKMWLSELLVQQDNTLYLIKDHNLPECQKICIEKSNSPKK